MGEIITGCLRFTLMAWFLAALAGIPAILVTVWGLSGGYSFRYLPFLLVPGALPFIVAPLIAGRLSGPSASRRSRVAALGIGLFCSGASGLAVLVIGIFAPFSLLDDSGHAIDNLMSLVCAGVLALAYVVAATVATVGFAARAAGDDLDATSADRYWMVRAVPLASGGVALLLLLSGVTGVASASRLDAAGIPSAPGAAWVAGRPESTLLYPGAAGVSAGAVGEERRLSHSREAEGGVTFYTAQPEAAVQAWYAERLQASGWKPITIGRADENGVWAYKRGDRELFVLRFYKPFILYANRSPYPGQGRFVTTYDVYPIGDSHL